MKPAFCLLPLVLAGCNSGPAVEERDTPVAEVAEKVRKAGEGQRFLRPGKWVLKATLEEFDAPGMPPAMGDKMKAMMASKPSTETCLTEADLKQPNADFFGGGANNCSYDHFTMGNGRIDAKMRCSNSGAAQIMTMAGTYDPDQYQMRMTTEMDAGAAMGAMRMTMRGQGRRIGDCGAAKG